MKGTKLDTQDITHFNHLQSYSNMHHQQVQLPMRQYKQRFDTTMTQSATQKLENVKKNKLVHYTTISELTTQMNFL